MIMAVKAPLMAGATMAAALTVPKAMLPPPLYSGPETSITIKRETLTQLGIAGRRIYEARCADCHGADAKGTVAGPNLMNTVVTYSDRRDFHQAVSQGARMPGRDLATISAYSDLSFNDIELIARYVREIRNPNTFR